MKRGGVVAFIGLLIWLLFTWACVSNGSVDETAREVLTVRLIGFIVVIAIAFFFFFKNFRK